MDAQLYMPDLQKYELEGAWLFKYIFTPFFWVAVEKNITNLSTMDGYWVNGNDVKENMTFMLWDYNHRYNLRFNDIVYGKTIKGWWTNIATQTVDTINFYVAHRNETYRLGGHQKDKKISYRQEYSINNTFPFVKIRWNFGENNNYYQSFKWPLMEGMGGGSYLNPSFRTLKNKNYHYREELARLDVANNTNPKKYDFSLRRIFGGPRYGKNSPMRRAVWDIEKLTLPHIRRKAYKARPFLMVDPLNGFGVRKFGVYRNNLQVPSKETDLKKLYPWVWGDHTYKSPLGHAYTRTHKYLWYQCAVVKQAGLWKFTWIPAQCNLMRFPFVCATQENKKYMQQF